jgi:AcrR family transcriptional regulator
MHSPKIGRNRTKKTALSGNPSLTRRKTDRRVARTRDLLGDALVRLMQEKPFKAITVQHVLDRAGVGRSTFYAHYKDKHDLFFSDAEEFFEAMATALSRHGDKSNRVAPVHEFFAHVAEWRAFHDAMMTAGKLQDVMEMGQEFFARGIAQRLAELRGVGAMAAPKRTALAHAFAGALFSMLSWWLRSNSAFSAEQIDTLYHQMVWASVALPVTPRFETGRIEKRIVFRQSDSVGHPR